jgi:hypothetical protein
VVDDNRDRVFLDAIEQKFCGLRSEIHGGVSFVRKVKFGDSGPDELLQLADMTCGAVGAHLDGDSAWYKMIESRTLGVTALKCNEAACLCHAASSDSI